MGDKQQPDTRPQESQAMPHLAEEIQRDRDKEWVKEWTEDLGRIRQNDDKRKGKQRVQA
jgi:hypothetical protein